MHLSSIIGVPLLILFAEALGWTITSNDAVTLWILISFTIAFIFILFILRKEMFQPMRDDHALSALESIFWGIVGIFLAFFSQSAAANIEYALGIEMGSENTQQIVGLIKTAPLIIFVTSIIGPILEEIVFRKIIFGSLYKRLNFFLAGLISSLIFSIAHGEPEHLILIRSNGLYIRLSLCKNKENSRTDFHPCSNEYNCGGHSTQSIRLFSQTLLLLVR